MSLEPKALAARYYVHKLRAHQYAVAVLRGEMGEDEARARYEEAMKNYDGIIAQAETAGASMLMDMCIGADAIAANMEAARKGGLIARGEHP